MDRSSINPGFGPLLDLAQSWSCQGGIIGHGRQSFLPNPGFRAGISFSCTPLLSPLYLASRPKRVLEGLEHELEPPPRGHPFCQLPVDSSLVRIDYQDITKGARERTPHFLQL